MAYTDIDDPSDFFTPHIWNGTSSNHTESIGMQPDLVWVKGRSVATDHTLFDVVRGFAVGKSLGSNTNAAEDGSNTTAYGGISGVTSDGFTVTAGSSNADYVNTSGRTYVSWNWKAGTSFTNDASSTSVGTIDSAGSVNTAAGFSIISYTGTGSAGTIAHGLGVKPDWIISKIKSTTGDWNVYHDTFGATGRIKLNSAAAGSNNTSIFAELPTSSVISVGNGGDINTSSGEHIFYCFAGKQGYSKFGTYEGNGNDDGPFINTGFAPAFVMVKCFDQGEHWNIYDNKRGASSALSFNLNNAERTMDDSPAMELLSNGFKIRTSDANLSNTDDSFFYVAFAEQPFVTSTGVPATAK